MADESQVAMLKRSVEEWNRWRAAQGSSSEDRPDLTRAKLANANLRGADLHDVDLRNAKLKKARLSLANLEDADLRRADLREALLDDANLTRANFMEADLSEAFAAFAVLKGTNLSHAKLRGTDLQQTVIWAADLDHTDLTSAFLSATAFLGIDLTAALGLTTCRFAAGCYIDYFTLAISKNLPLEFLRGAGVPQSLIDYLPSLTGKAVEFYSVFISYSTQDRGFAERLQADLQNNGVRCWFAPHDMLPGRKLHEQIDEAIRVYDRLLLILSDESMASEWVKTEIANARQKEVRQKRQVLFPISLVPFDKVRDWKAFDADTGKDSAREIREYFIPEFSNWKDHDSYKASFEKLLKGLRAD